ncbi:hypothetical protein IWX50DRAFT_656675 [Phyllosticta citricarpa]|uniref:Uncharacterized protein n=2 Tax=Phyllosticta TaxID=121621 RepID=A0ABR1ML37_9PEZI
MDITQITKTVTTSLWATDPFWALTAPTSTTKTFTQSAIRNVTQSSSTLTPSSVYTFADSLKTLTRSSPFLTTAAETTLTPSEVFTYIVPSITTFTALTRTMTDASAPCQCKFTWENVAEASGGAAAAIFVVTFFLWHWYYHKKKKEWMRRVREDVDYRNRNLPMANRQAPPRVNQNRNQPAVPPQMQARPADEAPPLRSVPLIGEPGPQPMRPSRIREPRRPGATHTRAPRRRSLDLGAPRHRPLDPQAPPQDAPEGQSGADDDDDDDDDDEPPNHVAHRQYRDPRYEWHRSGTGETWTRGIKTLEAQLREPQQQPPDVASSSQQDLPAAVPTPEADNTTSRTRRSDRRSRHSKSRTSNIPRNSGRLAAENGSQSRPAQSRAPPMESGNPNTEPQAPARASSVYSDSPGFPRGTRQSHGPSGGEDAAKEYTSIIGDGYKGRTSTSTMRDSAMTELNDTINGESAPSQNSGSSKTGASRNGGYRPNVPDIPEAEDIDGSSSNGKTAQHLRGGGDDLASPTDTVADPASQNLEDDTESQSAPTTMPGTKDIYPSLPHVPPKPQEAPAVELANDPKNDNSLKGSWSV